MLYNVGINEKESPVLQLTADKQQNLKEFTENNYAQGSFFWTQLMKNKDVKVNGARVGKDVPLNVGDTVCYYLTAKQETKPAFYTVYEDDNILIVDKESGVNSEAVFAALQREGEAKGETRCFIHRLDRNTQGLMAFAKTQEMESVLLAAFKQKKVEKIYHALCFGYFKKSAEVLTAYLKKNPNFAEVKIFDEQVKGAEKIVTEYKVLGVVGDMQTKVAVTLHTGKTHQIRAHLAHIGCPIAGDMKYGNALKNKEYRLSRQCLVAKYLRFELDGKWAYLNDKTFESRFDVDIEKTEVET